MHRLLVVLCSAALLGTVGPIGRAGAQDEPGSTPQADEPAARDASRDFDYLLGDWQFEADSRDWGRYGGYWSAQRLPDGQILDEYRVVGDEGEIHYRTTTLRAFNARLGLWELVGMEVGNGLRDLGTARRVGDEMHIEQRLGAMTDRPSVWRIRYYDIRPDRFSWTADRSFDEGNTWERGHLRMEARRIASRDD